MSSTINKDEMASEIFNNMLQLLDIGKNEKEIFLLCYSHALNKRGLKEILNAEELTILSDELVMLINKL